MKISVDKCYQIRPLTTLTMWCLLTEKHENMKKLHDSVGKGWAFRAGKHFRMLPFGSGHEHLGVVYFSDEHIEDAYSIAWPEFVVTQVTPKICSTQTNWTRIFVLGKNKKYRSSKSAHKFGKGSICWLWGAVCSMHTFVDRSKFCPTKVTFVWKK